MSRDNDHLFRAGARARWMAIHQWPGDALTLKGALLQSEQKNGGSLTLAERRAFMRGWRAGLANEAINRLSSAVHWLSKSEIEQLGSELQALAERYYPLSMIWGDEHGTADESGAEA